jgi:gluconolactonase
MLLFPPTRIEAHLFARLPDEFATPCVTAWSEANFAGRELGSFLEGPDFDAAGNLFVVDIPNGRIFRISPEGDFACVAAYGGWPNGLKILPTGKLLVADHRLGLVEVNPVDGAICVRVDGYRGEHFRGLNDLTLAPDGQVYFTDQGQSGLQEPAGAVYRWEPATGRLIRILSGIPSPNGLVFNHEGTHLFVAVTRDNAVWRLPFVKDGGVSKVGVFLNLSGGGGPDGLTVDAEGGFVVAQPGIGVLRFDTFGVLTHFVDAGPGASLSNIVFHGSGDRRLFITDSGRGQVLVAEMPYPGRRSSGV